MNAWSGCWAPRWVPWNFLCPEQLSLTFCAPLVAKGVENSWSYLVVPQPGGPFPHLSQGWSRPRWAGTALVQTMLTKVLLNVDHDYHCGYKDEWILNSCLKCQTTENFMGEKHLIAERDSLSRTHLGVGTASCRPLLGPHVCCNVDRSPECRKTARTYLSGYFLWFSENRTFRRHGIKSRHLFLCVLDSFLWPSNPGCIGCNTDLFFFSL